MHKVYYWYFQLTGLNWLKDRVVWREKNDQSTAHIAGQNMRRFLCPENPQLGWGFSKAFSFGSVIK
ncbi:hypothetical protein, partial [Yersinia pseudotuberculosis]